MCVAYNRFTFIRVSYNHQLRSTCSCYTCPFDAVFSQRGVGCVCVCVGGEGGANVGYGIVLFDMLLDCTATAWTVHVLCGLYMHCVGCTYTMWTVHALCGLYTYSGLYMQCTCSAWIVYVLLGLYMHCVDCLSCTCTVLAVHGLRGLQALCVGGTHIARTVMHYADCTCTV